MSIKELTEKRSALLSELQSEGVTAERFAEIRSEVKRLNFSIEESKKEMATEDRADSAERAAELRAARLPDGSEPETRGKVVLFDSGAEQRDADMSDADKLRYAKSALGKQVRAELKGLNVDLTKNEKRALGIAVTTTSETYTAPSASVNGINNGGIFIPQNVLYDLLEMDAPTSPFLRDVGATHIAGAVIFPYVEEAVPAEREGKEELEKSDDRSIKWGKLSLAQGNYSLTVQVTMELLNMTDEDFANYLLADIGNEINYLLTDEVLYGTGTNNRIAGVTVGAIAGEAYAEGMEMDAIRKGLDELSRRARNGAKIYISRSIALNLAFEKDKEGRYMFPLYNGTSIESIATIPVEVDENLKEGDFVIGNARNYKLNFIKPTDIYAELHGKERVIEYTAHLMVAGKAAPNKFYYGKKSAETAKVEGGDS